MRVGLILVGLFVSTSCSVQAQVTQRVSDVFANSDFDIISDEYDGNGFLLNPHWRWQGKPGNAGKIPDPDRLCANGLPNTAACTSQVTWENLPNIPKVFICMWSLKSNLIGHINWAPATYTGGLVWQEKTPDQDCNFGTKPTRNGGLTKGSVTAERGLLGLEFDSRETLKRMQSYPWAAIFKKLDQGGSPEEINSVLRAKTPSAEVPFAVLTGLFGVDCEHDCHTELHPVYGLALQIDPSAKDNVWAIFVRNWGNEGFCAHGQVELQLQKSELTLFLPHQGIKPTVKAETRFYTTWSNPEVPVIAHISSANSPGLAVTIRLPPPSEHALAEFELHLNWPDGTAGPSGGPVPQLQAAPNIATPQNVEEYLEQIKSSAQSVPNLEMLESASQRATERRNIPMPYPIRDATSLLRSTTVATSSAQMVTTVFDPIEQRQSEVLFDSFCNVPDERRPSWQIEMCKQWKSRRAETLELYSPGTLR